MMGQSKTLISSEIVFIALLSAGAQRCCAFYQAPQLEPNPHFFYFSSSNFTVQDHILSTAVDAFSRILFLKRRKTKEQILFVVVQ
jgi:hypothetical protein